nr:LacI family DNA-binding transcriptional regulator [Microbacterium excoecariae]
MRDVAERAGVSIATVSFVVNDTKPVSAETRARIETAMAELGFRRNVLARALASQRTHILAIVFPALEHTLGTTALGVVTSAAVAAARAGFNLVLWPVSNDPQQLDEYVSSGLVDGVLLMEVTAEDPRIPALERREIPFGLVGRTADPSAHLFVDMDFAGAVREGLAHLEERGHRNIALLSGELASDQLVGYGPIVRTEGAFSEAMRERGREPVIVRAPQDPRSGRAAARALVADHPDVTAVLALNEGAVHGFLNGLVAAGRQVPRDVSVLGLATSEQATTTADPALSALVAPGEELGRASVAALVSHLANPADRVQRLVPCELRLAGSTGAVRTDAHPLRKEES